MRVPLIHSGLRLSMLWPRELPVVIVVGRLLLRPGLLARAELLARCLCAELHPPSQPSRDGGHKVCIEAQRERRTSSASKYTCSSRFS